MRRPSHAAAVLAFSHVKVEVASVDPDPLPWMRSSKFPPVLRLTDLVAGSGEFFSFDGHILYDTLNLPF